jgi:hypothetical protein
VGPGRGRPAETGSGYTSARARRAYPDHQIVEGDEVTIQYTRGPNDKPKGSLTPGRSVKVKNKMVFDVYLTSRS